MCVFQWVVLDDDDNDVNIFCLGVYLVCIRRNRYAMHVHFSLSDCVFPRNAILFL